MGARTRGLANNVLTGGKIDATDGVSGVIDEANIADASLTSATTFGSVSGGIDAVSSDPPSPTLGDAWYNTTAGKLKFRADVGAWATGANLNTARAYMQGSGATQTAALISGGANPGGTPKAENESYDGSSWTEVGDLPAGKQNAASAGTQTATFVATGLQPWPNSSAVSYEWGGSSWTEIAEVNTARYGATGLGSTEAALIGGGYDGSNTQKNESFNGTSWTEVNDFNTSGPRERGSCGTLTAGFAAGGEPPATADTETWDGTSWTEVNNLNESKHGLRVSGTQTLAIASGGNSGKTSTELWNGTTWSEDNDLNEGSNQHGSAGTQTAAVIAGGDKPGISVNGEEWTIAEANTEIGGSGITSGAGY